MPQILTLTHFLDKNKQLYHCEILTAQKRNNEQINKNEYGTTKQIL